MNVLSHLVTDQQGDRHFSACVPLPDNGENTYTGTQPGGDLPFAVVVPGSGTKCKIQARVLEWHANNTARLVKVSGILPEGVPSPKVLHLVPSITKFEPFGGPLPLDRMIVGYNVDTPGGPYSVPVERVEWKEVENGVARASWYGHAALLASNPDAGSSHAGGVHLWVTRRAGDSWFYVDTLWHTGLADHKWAGREIGYLAFHSFGLKAQGAVRNLNGPRDKAIEAKGDVHVMPQGGRLERRYLVSDDGQEVVPVSSDLGLCKGLVYVASGGPLSWESLGYSAVDLPLGVFKDAPVWRERIEVDRLKARNAIENGTPYEIQGYNTDVGFFHPHGVPYYGMTGGDGTQVQPGWDIIGAQAPSGLERYFYLHRMTGERQRGLAWWVDGSPVKAEQLTDATGRLMVDTFSNVWLKGQDGPLGFAEAAPVYADHAYTSPYFKPLTSPNVWDTWMAHDRQHGIRAIRPSIALTQLVGDDLAAKVLAAQAELWRMEAHEGPGGRLWATLDAVKKYPHTAVEFGREMGWGMTASVLAWLSEDTKTRGRWDPWFRACFKVAEMAITPNDAIHVARYNPKTYAQPPFDGEWGVTQWYEQAIVVFGLAGVRQFFADEPMVASALDALIYRAGAASAKGAWFDGDGGPRYASQTVSLNPAQGIIKPLPLVSSNHVDGFQAAAGYAAALRAMRRMGVMDPEFEETLEQWANRGRIMDPPSWIGGGPLELGGFLAALAHELGESAPSPAS